MIFSDSLSTLQVEGKLKTARPLLIQIQDMLHKIGEDQEEITSMWTLDMLVFREIRLLK